MSGHIVPFRGDLDAVLRMFASVCDAGSIPLIGDARWPDAQWDAVRHRAQTAAVPGDAAWATTTSGSSGTPRILVRSARSWAASFPLITDLLGGAETVALPAPPASSLTLFSLAHARSGGPAPAFSPAEMRAATAVHGTPQGFQRLLDADAIPAVRTALIGGSTLDPALRARAEARGIRVVTYYGAAELSYVAVDHGRGLRPLPGVDIEVRAGTLWVRSPFAALGYLGENGPLRRAGDWITVGDLATLDAGVLALRGRSDGAIQTASATVIPEEVEETLRLVPGIAEAVVFAYPAGNVGSLVAVILDSASGRDAGSVSALRDRAAALLAPAHRPRLWFIGEIPRTAAGKPARAEIVRRVLAGEVERVIR